MRILFDASQMPPRRAGAGVYMYRLGRALAAHAAEHPLLLVDRHGAFADLAGMPGVTVRRVDAGGRARRFLWEQTALPRLAREWGADVIHGPHHSLPLLRAGRAAVVTVHDITFDLLPRRYPLARRLYMRAITRLGLTRAHRVIVPSSFVRDALARRYGVPSGRVHVVPEAAAPDLARVQDQTRLAEVRARYGLPDRVLFSLGTLEPGKNRETLFAALREVRRRGLPHVLAVAGQQGWLVDHRRDLGDLEDAVQLLGYVPDSDLGALYSLADAFLFPSWLEGFGLPPLEAMQCGTPVISSARPAMPEVLGTAALYADPRQPNAWADAIERLTTDTALRDDLVKRGLARAARYNWARAARETLTVYAAALGAAPPPAPVASAPCPWLRQGRGEPRSDFASSDGAGSH